MTAELIDRVRAAGADLQPIGECLRVLHPEKLDPAMIEELRREKPALMRALEAQREAVAIVSAQRLSASAAGSPLRPFVPSISAGQARHVGAAMRPG